MKARSDSSGGDSLQTGAVAFIQRFTKTLGLFPHVHVGFSDGVWVEVDDGRAEFREAARPDVEMFFEVGRRVFTRLARFLKREGYPEPTEGDAPGALDRWWMRATQDPRALPSRPRLIPAPASQRLLDSRGGSHRGRRPRRSRAATTLRRAACVLEGAAFAPSRMT